MQGSCQHRCTPFFGRPLREFDWQIRNLPQPCFFARDGYQQRQGMQTAARVGVGVDDSQSVELRDRAGNGHDCRNAATVQRSTYLTIGHTRRFGPLDRDLSSLGTAVKKQATKPQIRIVRLISSSKRISDSNQTSRHVRFAFHVQRGSVPRAG